MAYEHVILQSPLFLKIEKEDLCGLLSCLSAKITGYNKDNAIFSTGDKAQFVGLVLDGAVQVERSDIYGNRMILSKLQPGDLFGEAFACAGIDALPVSVYAVSDCNILLMDYRRIITTCSSSCGFHHRLIENMLRILADKNILLNQKIEVLSARTLREKLLTYLHAIALKTESNCCHIPFNRQELADYLSVDRSALSREIGIMQQEGLIKCNKNKFELI